ncbi:MAG: hypothetical protein R3305_03490 [Gammaproteobacteria bacterium]|nr:hypothetical protein [Gammaproteobacteria bacterium]
MKSAKLATALRSALAVCLVFSLAPNAFGQFGAPAGPSGPPRDIAPIDLTGQWVSVITEDWRFRIVTPPANDYPGLPLNQAARQAAAAWDPAQDAAAGNECKAYGVGGIMRMPGRLRIDWDDESTLELRFDAGRQIRRLQFTDEPVRDGAGTWQGISTAEWELHGRSGNGTLKVVTTDMRAGYFRKNGVPYSENAVLTEYFDLLTQHDGSEWLVVLSILDDPTYFNEPLVTSTNFRREDGRGGWNPTDCSVD